VLFYFFEEFHKVTTLSANTYRLALAVCRVDSKHLLRGQRLLDTLSFHSKQLTKTLDVVGYSRSAQTAPHLGLVAGDDRFAGYFLDFRNYFERADAAAA
jgi:DNA-binding SARP family transcriptional activator